MNITKSSGESSCRGQENGDSSTGSERPLKKARFAWQVKGKYHLKNDIPDPPNNAAPTTTSDRATTSNASDMGTEQNLEMLGDYLLKQDFNTLDSVIADSEKSLLTPSTSISTEKIQYPRYVSSYDNNESSRGSRTSQENSDVVSLPMSMVVSQNYTEDECIARWQARQMAKGFVDNTINRVLESWVPEPSPPEDNSRYLGWDIAEIINNLPGDNTIENEGILMAISAHGLQNTSSNSNNGSKSDDNSDYGAGFCNLPLSVRSLSPLSSDDENTSTVNVKCDESDLNKSLLCNDQKNDVGQFSLFPDSSLSYQCFSENQNSSIEYDENVTNNHYDFLDAAVMFAIQNKGLTAFGTDYG
ncbi:hypothetical protein O3G_MSEX012583 [Manduca sexta]|uniref:Uncharacterized protein n=1 Tax=Manduca sexta TaxID=7130 RepID=A0A921ZR45_MANSE|nr:hypothetical protein O3G_MSEX012583 [Manduca sexta]